MVAISVHVLSLLLYALLMVLPFVPGVEIGPSLLVTQGAAVAQFVFLATYSGLAIAYLVGRLLPKRMLHEIFSDISLKRTTQLIERLAPRPTGKTE